MSSIFNREAVELEAVKFRPQPQETVVELAVAVSRLRRFIEDNASDKREYAEYRGYLNTLINAPEILPRPISGSDL